MDKKVLIIVHSYHHGNTQKIAETIAEVLKAEVKKPQDVSPKEIQEYDFIGFGAGIDSGKHYKPMLEFAQKLPKTEKRVFIFSTCGIYGRKKMFRDHAALREILSSKGYVIEDEFSCAALDTNSVLKYFGGINKGKPNMEDFENAKAFARGLAAK